MKHLIFGTLAILLLLSQTVQAQEWEEISPSDVADEDDSDLLEDLLDVAVGYVLQKGKFESTKAPLPGDFYWEDRDNVKYERRVTSTLTYYRYSFLLKEDHNGPSAVSATVVVSYDPSNYNYIVTDYDYNVDYFGNEEQNFEISEWDADTENTLIDTRTLIGDGDLAKLVSDSFEEITAQNINGGRLPEANYTMIRVYRAYSVQFDGVKQINDEGEVNEYYEYETEGWILPSQGYKYYNFWIKFKSSERTYHLVKINIHYVKDRQTGEFGPEIFSLDGFPELDWADQAPLEPPERPQA